METTDDAQPRRVRITRIEVASAARLGGVVGCVLGLVVGVVLVVYGLRSPQTPVTLLNPLFALLFGALGCMALCALCALAINATTRYSGGLVLTVEEPSPHEGPEQADA